MKTKRVVLTSESGERSTTSERKAKLIVVLLCLGLSALATVPFFFTGDSPDGSSEWKMHMPVTHDIGVHYDQMKSFYHGLAAGKIYPRWADDTNRGFGAPTTSYYPPGVYYLTSAIYLIVGNWMLTLLIAHLLIMIASATAIYIYAHQFINRFAATAAMATYIFLPYHLIDQYQRGAMAELMGFIWMPLMLLFGERLFMPPSTTEMNKKSDVVKAEGLSDKGWKSRTNSETIINVSGLAASFGAFLWSHTPTAYQFLLAFGLYVLLLAWMRKDWAGLLIWAGAMMLGLGLSAAYLYPAVMEQNLIRHEYVSIVWPYHKSYVFVHQMHDADSDAGRNFFSWINFIWIFNLLAVLIGALSLFVLEPQSLKFNRILKQRVLLWVIVGLVASFMMTKASYPLGRMIPKIEIGVFTWRMLSITTLVAALLTGVCVQAAYNSVRQKRSDTNSIVSLAALIIIAGSFFTAVKLLPPMYHGTAFEPEKEHFEYVVIPRSAPRDIHELPKVNKAEFAKGNGQISIERWDPEHRSLQVELTEPDRLLIRTFNFPGWTATIDGKPATIYTGDALRIQTDDSQESLIRAASFKGVEPIVDGKPAKIVGSEPLGDIILEVPPGVHQVKLDYLDTSARRLGNLMTLASLLVLFTVLFLALFKRWQRRNLITNSLAQNE